MNQQTAACFFVLIFFVATASSQTFQYSRGWTNGKRRAEAVASGPSQAAEERSLVEDALAKAVTVEFHSLREHLLLEKLGRAFRTLDRVDEEQQEYYGH
ncbi:pro-corazonin-like [Ornithodoros turicata]|uniref:pro-corazonin-like n=1 Tax=Ornithodoros turicata TaxID=34597 RepID=UPI003139E64C